MSTTKLYAKDFTHSGPTLSTAVIGAAGSGKTYHYIRPNLQHMNGDNLFLVTADESCLEAIPDNYDVTVVNLRDPKKMDGIFYNPLLYLQRDTDIQTLAECMMESTKPSESVDKFWEQAQLHLLRSVLSYLHIKMVYELPGEKTMGEITQLLSRIEEDETQYQTSLLDYKNSYAFREYCIYNKAGNEIARKKIATLLASRLEAFHAPVIRDMFSKDTLNLTHLLREPNQAMVVVLSNYDMTYNCIASMIATQMMQIALSKVCDPHLRIILDEFQGYYVPENLFLEFLLECRTFCSSVDYSLQSVYQFMCHYPNIWRELLDMSNIVLMAPVISYDDCEYFSKMFGVRRRLFKKYPVFSARDIARMPATDCIVYLADKESATNCQKFS